MRQHDVEVREVAGDGQQVRRVGQLVHRAGEAARAAVHDQRHTALDEHLVGRVERGVVAAEAAVHRVQLECRGAVVELAADLVSDREVQVRVDVGDRTEPPRVVLDDGQQVVEGLVAGGLGAVLAEEQRGVDALLLEERVEGSRLRSTVRVPEVVEDAGRAEVPRPLDPRGPDRAQHRDVDVGVDEEVAVEHGWPPVEDELGVGVRGRRP